MRVMADKPDLYLSTLLKLAEQQVLDWRALGVSDVALEQAFNKDDICNNLSRGVYHLERYQDTKDLYDAFVIHHLQDLADELHVDIDVEPIPTNKVLFVEHLKDALRHSTKRGAEVTTTRQVSHSPREVFDLVGFSVSFDRWLEVCNLDSTGAADRWMQLESADKSYGDLPRWWEAFQQEYFKCTHNFMYLRSPYIDQPEDIRYFYAERHLSTEYLASSYTRESLLKALKCLSVPVQLFREYEDCKDIVKLSVEYLSLVGSYSGSANYIAELTQSDPLSGLLEAYAVRGVTNFDEAVDKWGEANLRKAFSKIASEVTTSSLDVHTATRIGVVSSKLDANYWSRLLDTIDAGSKRECRTLFKIIQACRQWDANVELFLQKCPNRARVENAYAEWLRIKEDEEVHKHIYFDQDKEIPAWFEQQCPGCTAGVVTAKTEVKTTTTTTQNSVTFTNETTTTRQTVTIQGSNPDVIAQLRSQLLDMGVPAASIRFYKTEEELQQLVDKYKGM